MVIGLPSVPPDEFEPPPDDIPPLEPDEVDDPAASMTDGVPPEDEDGAPPDPEAVPPELEPVPESIAGPGEPPEPPMGPQATPVKRATVRKALRTIARLLSAIGPWSEPRSGPAQESTGGSRSYAVANASHSTSGAVVLHPSASHFASFGVVMSAAGTAEKLTVSPLRFNISARG